MPTTMLWMRPYGKILILERSVQEITADSTAENNTQNSSELEPHDELTHVAESDPTHVVVAEESDATHIQNVEITDAWAGADKNAQAWKHLTAELDSLSLRDSSSQLAASETHAFSGIHKTAVAAPVAKLVGLSGIEKDRIVGLSLMGGVVGRGSRCTVVLNEAAVSREHARLSFDGQGCIVEDLASGNGTFLNERRIQKARVKSGDELRFGNAKFRFVHEDENTAPSSADSASDIHLSEKERPSVHLPRWAFAVVGLLAIIAAGVLTAIKLEWGDNTTGARQTMAAEHYELGLAAFQQRDFERAITEFTITLNLNPEDANARALLDAIKQETPATSVSPAPGASAEAASAPTPAPVVAEKPASPAPTRPVADRAPHIIPLNMEARASSALAPKTSLGTVAVAMPLLAEGKIEDAAATLLTIDNADTSASQLRSELKEFREAYEAALVEHRAKRVTTAIAKLAAVKALAMRFWGGNVPQLMAQIDRKVADMYYVQGVDDSLNSRTEESVKNFRMALSLCSDYLPAIRQLEALGYSN